MKKKLYVFLNDDGISVFAYLTEEQVKVFDLIEKVYDFTCNLCTIDEVDTVDGFGKEDK